MNLVTLILCDFLTALATETDNPDTQYKANLVLDNIRADVAYAPPQTPKTRRAISQPMATHNAAADTSRFFSFTDLLSHFENHRQINNTSVLVNCPCHADTKPSLQITQGAKRYMFNCFAGCNYRDIWRAVGIEHRNFTIEDGTQPPAALPYPRIENKRRTATNSEQYNPADFFHYTYYDLDGKPTATKHRHKTNKANMRWYHYTPGLIYTPDIDRLRAADTIAYCEGEKDADTLTRLNIPAFTCGGSNQWATECARWTQGKNLLIFADNDEPGIKLARRVYDDCENTAASVRLIIPTPAIHKGDITDFIENGGDIAELLKRA